MSIQVIDPRIPAPVAPTRPADRVPNLAGRRILLLDNGKLAPEYGPYSAVFDVVRETLADEGAEVVEQADDLLLGGLDRLAGLADRIAGQGVHGVVIGLGDWGVSQPMTLLAARLEGRGIATSSVTTEVGGRLMVATATLMSPGLPVTVLSALRSATREEIARQTTAALSDIIGGLTGTPAELADRFARHDVVTASTASGGLLDVGEDDPSARFTQLMRDNGLGDGLPLVAPTPERVDAFVAATGAGPDDLVWPAVPPRDVPVTVRQVAAVAVAAGCQPLWAPVVVAAFRGMGAPEFRLFQAAITTHPSGTLVLVSGPDHERFGFAAGRGSLGPGCPANATTGRAVALGGSFLLGSLPGGANLIAQGSPAAYTYCCAENLADSPWPGLHADLGFADTTTVTVLRCEGPHNLTDQESTEPTALLDTFASTMTGWAANAAYVPHTETALLLNPEHATLLADAGWTKHDIRQYLFETARNPRADLLGRGLAPHWPAWARELDRVPIVPGPDALLVAVVGGSGPASQFTPPWGYSRAVTVPVT
jgi:hypothetical protein